MIDSIVVYKDEDSYQKTAYFRGERYFHARVVIGLTLGIFKYDIMMKQLDWLGSISWAMH